MEGFEGAADGFGVAEGEFEFPEILGGVGEAAGGAVVDAAFVEHFGDEFGVGAGEGDNGPAAGGEGLDEAEVEGGFGAGAEEDAGFEHGGGDGVVVGFGDGFAGPLGGDAVIGAGGDEAEFLAALLEDGEGFVEGLDVGSVSVHKHRLDVALDGTGGFDVLGHAEIGRGVHDAAFVGDFGQGVAGEVLGIALEEGAGAFEEEILVIEGIEPEFMGGGGGGEIGEDRGGGRGGDVFQGAGDGELVFVEIDDGGFAGEAGDEAVEIGEIEGFGGEDHVDFGDPMEGELLGKPMGGGDEAAFDAARGEFEEGPTVAAAFDEGIEHGLAGAAVVGFDGENVEGLEHLLVRRDHNKKIGNSLV